MKMTENRSYLQKYAMHFGTYMGAYWILKFILLPLMFAIPFFQLLYVILTLAVPIIGYYYVKIYRDKVCGGAIQFELTMPGTLLSSNASLSTNNIMVWKIDGLRLLTGNYVLTAESRVINYWAFGLTLLIILATLGIFIKLYRNR